MYKKGIRKSTTQLLSDSPCVPPLELRDGQPDPLLHDGFCVLPSTEVAREATRSGRETEKGVSQVGGAKKPCKRHFGVNHSVRQGRILCIRR